MKAAGSPTYILQLVIKWSCCSVMFRFGIDFGFVELANIVFVHGNEPSKLFIKLKKKMEKVSISRKAKASASDLSYRNPSTQRHIGADKPWIHDCRIRRNLSSAPLYNNNKRPSKIQHLSTHNSGGSRGKAKGRCKYGNRELHIVRVDRKVSNR